MTCCNYIAGGINPIPIQLPRTSCPGVPVMAIPLGGTPDGSYCLPELGDWKPVTYKRMPVQFKGKCLVSKKFIALEDLTNEAQAEFLALIGAADASVLEEHILSTTAHGTETPVVGTDDSQILTNKHLPAGNF